MGRCPLGVDGSCVETCVAVAEGSVVVVVAVVVASLDGDGVSSLQTWRLKVA